MNLLVAVIRGGLAERVRRLLDRPLLAEILVVAALTLAASLLRTLFLTEFPPGLQGDESWSGLEAKRILEEGWIGIWTEAGWGQPTGPMYWTALFFQFLPDDTVTLRLSYAAFGFLSIPAFYLFAREFFGRRPALLGTVLLALSSWHIHFSRTAFTLNAAVLLECLALFLMAIGLRKDKVWLSLLGGMVVGMGVFTYRGNNAFIMALVAAWLFMAGVGDEQPRRRLLHHGLAFWLPALLLAIPMIHLVLTRTSDYRGYVDVISIFNTQEFKDANGLWEQFAFLLGEAKRGIGIYFVGGGPDFTSGLGDYPILDRLTMVLFAVGLAVSLWRWRNWRYFLMLAGVAIGVCLVATTVDWGASRRNIGALPMVFAAAALGGDWLIQAAGKMCRRVSRLRFDWFYPAAAAVTIFVAVLNIPFYFGEVGRSDIAKFAYAYELSRAAVYLDSLPQEPYVYFYSDRWSYGYEARRFQAPAIPGEDRGRFCACPLSIEITSDRRPAVFVLMPDYASLAQELAIRYPQGRYIETREGQQFIFGAFLVP
jgi:4-amino-4-deoxy-L-arabinose transferase-like glycosyltransferase